MKKQKPTDDKRFIIGGLLLSVKSNVIEKPTSFKNPSL